MTTPTTDYLRIDEIRTFLLSLAGANYYLLHPDPKPRYNQTTELYTYVDTRGQPREITLHCNHQHHLWAIDGTPIDSSSTRLEIVNYLR